MWPNVQKQAALDRANGVENIFKRVALEIDGALPGGLAQRTSFAAQDFARCKISAAMNLWLYCYCFMSTHVYNKNNYQANHIPVCH
ncbi:MAG: hypothetical protein M5U34_34565 [Chloroflexi bacterium]|nr:hypothetical protein [Chloroflexota bacterium]